MQNKKINKISLSYLILIFILIIFMLFITNSVFLILFINTLTIILAIFLEINVKEFVVFIKKHYLFLLFLSVTFIIINRDLSILNFFAFEYKILNTIILFKILIKNISYENLCDALYTLFSFFERTKVDIKKLSIYVCQYFYLFHYFNISREEIKKIQYLEGKRKFGLKSYWLPAIFMANEKLNKLELNLKLRYYEIKKEKINLLSKFLMIFFIILLFLTIFKEVNL